MTAWLVVRLLTFMCSLLPEDRRAQHLHDWITESLRTEHPLRYAISFLPAALRMRAPYEVRPEDEVPVRRSDRFQLALTRFWVVSLGVLLVLLDLTLLLLGTGVLADEQLVRWMVGAHMMLGLAYGLAWFGLGADWPWLRTTRLGSAIMLVVAVWPFIWLWLGRGQMPSTAGLMFWVFSTFTLMTWDAYWGVKRPLRKRGVFSR